MFSISQVQLIEKQIWHIPCGIKYTLKNTLMITDTEMLNSSGLGGKNTFPANFSQYYCYFVTLVLISASK